MKQKKMHQISCRINSKINQKRNQASQKEDSMNDYAEIQPNVVEVSNRRIPVKMEFVAI